MPWSGGVFTRTNGVFSGATVWASDKAAGTKITAAHHDTHDQDEADGINACLNKNGQNSPTANISWGGFKITNLAAGASNGDAVRYEQVIGVYQPIDAGLTSIAGLTTAADKGIYTTALDVYAVYTLTAGGRALGGVAGTADTFPYFSASNTVTLVSITAAGRAILDDADASAQRTTLGLGTIATQAASAVAITGGTVASVRLTELKQDVTAASSTTFDLSAGHVIKLTHGANITSLTISNPPASGEAFTITIVRTKDAGGTARTISWPAAVKWPSGTAPTLTSTANSVDVITLFSIDGGTTYRGTFALAFS